MSGGIKSTFVVRSIPDIPDLLESFADVTYPVNLKGDFPFYWDILLGGGTLIKHIFGKCLNFTQASEIGMHQTDKSAEFDKVILLIFYPKYFNFFCSYL